MKKTILAVVTTSLLAASANAATVYDKDGQTLDVTGRLQYEAGQKSSSTTGEANNFGGDALARFGFEGKWATGSDVTLIGKGEWEVSAEADEANTVTTNTDGDLVDTGDNNKLTNRYAYAGADFGNGVQATVGTQDSAFVQLGDVTDIFNEYSGSAEYQLLDGDTRWDDSAKVVYAADGWDLRASVGFADAAKTDTAAEVQNSYAVTSGYTFEIDDVQSLKAVVGYQAVAGDIATGNYTDAQYGIGLGYTYDALYVGTTYGQAKYESDDNHKDTLWAVSAAYKFQPDWTATAGYALVDGHNYAGETTKYYELGIQYDITAKAMAYAEYKLNQVPGQDDNYYVGLQYNF